MTDEEYIKMRRAQWDSTDLHKVIGRWIVVVAVLLMGSIGAWLLLSQIIVPSGM